VLLISERFNGPPGSAHGGYTCGLVAGLLGDGAAEVSLRSPPPLGRELEVSRSADGVAVRDGSLLVAEGRAAHLQLEAPEPVGVEEAALASMAAAGAWATGHPFPSCVVCGPDRAEGDGYRLFPGALSDRPGLFATVWTPDPSLADGAGVRAECVWAALDCPTAAPVATVGRGATVLAQLTARLDGAVEPGRPHVVVSWALGVDGRKRHAGAALYTAEGAVLARSRALWIERRV
jgi:hypothetical protein